MKIEHIAIWVKNLEKTKEFYMKFFDMESNNKYENNDKKFESYFLSFPNGCRLEIMQKPGILELENEKIRNHIGLIHFAISVKNKENVVEMTEKIRKDGYKVLSEPRTTGDGYFESIVEDPDGNMIEITV